MGRKIPKVLQESLVAIYLYIVYASEQLSRVRTESLGLL